MWIVEYRELIRILTISDLKVKYQSSVLGFAWSLLNPLLMMLVLYAVFSNVFKFDEDSFALYILVGIVGWRFLQNATTASMSSIVVKQSLVTKVYVPRQILVLSSVLSSFTSSILEFSVLAPLLFLFGVDLSINVLLFPFIHVTFLILIYGLSLILASLYVYYRDLNQIWEVLLQAGFFLSPIVYPISIVPEKYLSYYMMNPVTIIIEMYREALLYAKTPLLQRSSLL
jgi:lipopolysaccharide transport system permease protein